MLDKERVEKVPGICTGWLEIKLFAQKWNVLKVMFLPYNCTFYGQTASNPHVLYIDLKLVLSTLISYIVL